MTPFGACKRVPKVSMINLDKLNVEKVWWKGWWWFYAWYHHDADEAAGADGRVYVEASE